MHSRIEQSRGFRLAQISDCHLSARADTPYRGLSADAGLAAVVKAVATWQPDALMLTGDLSEDGSEASYQRLAELIEPLNAPVCALPGNHDVPELMQQYFPQGPYESPYFQQAGDWKVVLLNSARPGRIDGCIDNGDLLRVNQYLAGDGPALLALHHQPMAIGSPWIDKYRLEQPEGLMNSVADHPQIKAVVWGHVHQAFAAQIGSARFMSAPSTAANSLPASAKFTLDPAGPAFRWLELFADGRMNSGILHAPTKGLRLTRQHQPQHQVNDDARKGHR
ncbi:MAG: phosphodiesterase [Xanthomonadales bacterium]|nr:phosphodiesterase [Xanthomonadales bacterium]